MSELNPEITPIVGEIKEKNLRILNWNKTWLVVGAGFNSRILDDIEHRRVETMQNFYVCVGSPGDGKSYFCLRLAQILQKNFNPKLQIVFDRNHLLYLIGAESPLKRGDVIFLDECEWSVSSRSWMQDAQKDLVNHIESLRSRGFIILLSCLHLSIIDNIIRKYVVNGMLKMKKRGQATMYKLWMPTFEDKLYKKKVGNMSLQLPDAEICICKNCLTCKWLNAKTPCMTNRAIYERLKAEFLAKKSAESTKKAEARDRKKQELNFDSIFQILLNNQTDLVYNRKTWGKPEAESIKLILEKKNIKLTDAEARKVVKRGQIMHPEIFNKDKVMVNKDERKQKL